jgi:hypothetical protein
MVGSSLAEIKSAASLPTARLSPADTLASLAASLLTGVTLRQWPASHPVVDLVERRSLNLNKWNLSLIYRNAWSLI